MRLTTRRWHEAKGVCENCRAFTRTKVATLLVAYCLEWKSAKGGVLGWNFPEGFGMEGILHQERGGYQLIFAGQMPDSR
jgi:hypothetical protein